jgi:hypothetical protein
MDIVRYRKLILEHNQREKRKTENEEEKRKTKEEEKKECYYHLSTLMILRNVCNKH